MKKMTPPVLRRGLFGLAIALAALTAAAQQGPAGREEAQNMRLVGMHDLQARSAYHPVIHQQGSRWIAYVGHHGGKTRNPLTNQDEDNGTSILDVTDPSKPRMLAHIPGEPGLAEQGGAQMVRMCPGAGLGKADPNKFYLLRSFGNTSHQIFDVTAPERPVMVTEVSRGQIRDTHKNFWECDTGIAYLVSGVKGWQSRRMLQVFDFSDPTKPRHVRDYGIVGQEPGSTPSKEMESYELHGAIRVGNRVYMGYGTNRAGVVHILDRDKLLRGNPAAANPLAPTPENLRYPEINRFYTGPRHGAHTTFPILGMPIPEFAKNTEGATRDILIVVNEAIANECRENRQMAYFVDITSETMPWGVGSFQIPESPGNFCERGGRFGTHSSNESMTSPYHKKVVFLAYFNAGVRAVDFRNPYMPKEVGYYVPAITPNTDKRCVRVDGQERCKIAIQTNNLEVDDRGLVYLVDRANTGLHIVELSAAGRAAAGMK